MADSKKKQKKKERPATLVRKVGDRQVVTRMPVVVSNKVLRLFLKAVQDAKLLHLAKGGSAKDFRLKRSEIPFWDALFGKGTQAPGFRLYMSTQTITITASTAYTSVIKVELDQYLNYADLANVFDEYRPLRAMIEFVPNQQVIAATTTFSTGVAAIDYDDTAALGSLDGAAAYDTHKFFQYVGLAGIAKPTRWNVDFDWLPDEQWLTTATANSPFATWKPYIGSSHGLSTSAVGIVTGWCDFQFRGMD